jgi:hypothetical protein
MRLHSLLVGWRNVLGPVPILLALALLNLCVQSCSGSAYSFQAFSFPPGSRPHENDWQYSGRVIVTSPEIGPLTKRSDKRVEIRVVDRQNKVLLRDVLRFQSGTLKPP